MVASWPASTIGVSSKVKITLLEIFPTQGGSVSALSVKTTLPTVTSAGEAE